MTDFKSPLGYLESIIIMVLILFTTLVKFYEVRCNTVRVLIMWLFHSVSSFNWPLALKRHFVDMQLNFIYVSAVKDVVYISLLNCGLIIILLIKLLSFESIHTKYTTINVFLALETKLKRNKSNPFRSWYIIGKHSLLVAYIVVRFLDLQTSKIWYK